jgi:hypothetical protein
MLKPLTGSNARMVPASGRGTVDRTTRPMLSPEALLARYPEDVRVCMERLRELVRNSVPEAKEQSYPGWKAVGYRSPDAGYFCGLFPQDDHVLVGFERGSTLSDPNGLLERPKTGRASGTLRYLRIPATADDGSGRSSVDSQALTGFVMEAASQSSEPTGPPGSPNTPRTTRGAPG